MLRIFLDKISPNEALKISLGAENIKIARFILDEYSLNKVDTLKTSIHYCLVDVAEKLFSGYH